jgi:1-phosphatidylinositol-4-phosphate 5-kinase
VEGRKPELGAHQGDELELTTVNFQNLSRKQVQDEKLGECVQRAIEELGPEFSSAYIMFEARMTKVEQIRPDVFQQLRRIAGVSDRYMPDLCNFPFEGAPEWVQQRPSWASSSGKFLLQGVDAEQVAYFRSIADKYLEHLEKHRDSLICSLLGLYAIQMKNIPGGWFHVAIFKNFLPSGAVRKLDYLYKLCGTEKDRFVQRTGVAAQLLKDANFVKEQQVVMLAKERHEAFKEALDADASFLEEIRAVGYSMMLGVRKTDATEQAPHSSTLAVPEIPTVTKRSNKSIMPRGHLQSEADDEMFSGTACGSSAGPSLSPRDGQGSSGLSSQRKEGQHIQFGWRPNARAKSAEQVLYYFGIVDVLQPWNFRKGVRYVTSKAASGFKQLEIEPPSAYQHRFLSFIEDRILPLNSVEDFFKLKSLSVMQRAPIADGLSMAAAAEAEDAQRRVSTKELARFSCLIDAMEAGEETVQRWVELGLVEANVLRGLDAFRKGLQDRRLPPIQDASNGSKSHPSGVALLKIGKLVNSLSKAQSLKGKLLSDSSTQYSLALAIAVGVEAATNCSARLFRRCAVLFEQHPKLATRPASVFARRRFQLPEEGSWLSPPHMLPELNFVEHAPEVFRRIRFLSGLNDQAYIHCVCQREFSFIEFTTNSKSGEFFFFTHDGRCMVKTISESEAEALIRLLSDGYFEHLSDPSGSLLTRIYGLYQVQLPWFKSGKPQYFMVQENVLYTSNKMMARFDLKGSTFGRTAKPGESVQKDNDWISKGLKFGFAPELREKIARQHRHDCEFLAASRCIDYSVLVGICDNARGSVTHEDGSVSSKQDDAKLRGQKLRMARLRDAAAGTPSTGDGSDRILVMLPNRKPADLWKKVREEVFDIGCHGPHEGMGGEVFFFGIIDFLVTWTCKKRSEYAMRMLQCQAKTASVQPPWEYARRQIEFMESIM